MMVFSGARAGAGCPCPARVRESASAQATGSTFRERQPGRHVPGASATTRYAQRGCFSTRYHAPLSAALTAMPPIRILLATLVLLAAPAAATGCGGSDIAGGTDTAAPSVPQDRFTRQLSPAEAKQIGGAYGSAGTWKLTIGNGV